ncbi:MAG: hypothetical protein AAB337_03595 [Patescibacteria group bacterium]
MPQNPGAIRVVARATAIIRDEEGRFFLTFHPKQNHYFLVGGKAQYTEGKRIGKDIAETFSHIGRASEFVSYLFNMKRESSRAAGTREVWEELKESRIVSPMRWATAKKQFSLKSSLPAIEILNLCDNPHSGYRPQIDTKNIILPCEMRLPPKWEREVYSRWVKEKDRRDVTPIVWFATPTEIYNVHTTRGFKISPDVRHILLRLGFIPPIESLSSGPPKEDDP